MSGAVDRPRAMAYARVVTREASLGLFTGDSPEYRFCAPDWRRTRRPVPLEALLEEVRALDPARCARVTLRGSPLEHPGFDAVVEACRARGLRGLELETDARSLEGAAVESLAAHGFEKVFAIAGGIRRRVHEAVMRDDGLAESIEGLLRVAASPAQLYVVVPLLRWTQDDLEPLLDYLEEAGARPTGMLLYPPRAGRVPLAARGALLSSPEAARVAARAFAACARRKIEHGFFRKRGLLPCATGGALDRFGTVFFERMRLLRGRREDAQDGFVRIAACGACSLEQSCPGADRDYVEAFSEAELRPVPLETSMDWRLKPIHRLEPHGLKSVSAFENDAESNGRSLLRINGHCNMSCSFCFIDRTVPDLETEGLRRSIDQLAARHLDHLVLSGGEPTLHPDLEGLIAHAKSRGFRCVEIQSNGVKLAERAYAERLVEAGLDKVTVSLHSADPERSDRITRLPRAFEKTLSAIRVVRSLGVETQVAHVVTKSNYRELPDTVRFLREQFPEEGGSLSICFGIAQPISDLVYTWVLPRFEEVRPYMRRALDYCLEHDLGFGGMIGQGGYPPCMLDGELRYYEKNLLNVYRSGEGADFHKPERCRECSFDPYCLGVRKDYVETYGDEEIRPFRADVDALAASARPPAPEHPPLVQLRRRSAS